MKAAPFVTDGIRMEMYFSFISPTIINPKQRTAHNR
jgi:hypothetical protein